METLSCHGLFSAATSPPLLSLFVRYMHADELNGWVATRIPLIVECT